jgi:hypothetical protein
MTDIKRVRTSSGDVVDVKERIREGVPEGDVGDAVAEVAELRGRSGDVQLHTKLVPDANQALVEAIVRSGLGKSEAVNRLIMIGGFFDKMKRQGYDLLLSKDGATEKVHIV